MFLLVASVCNAGVEERIALCAASDSAEARIACLERDLRELAGEKPAAVELEAAPAERTASAEGGVAGTAVAEQDAGRSETAGAAEVELGSDQVAARNRSGEEEPLLVRAEVVDFRFVGYRRLMVQLDNGQVWRQIDGDRTSVERGLRGTETFEVEMWGTKLGGYRMRIVPVDRTIRVERLR